MAAAMRARTALLGCKLLGPSKSAVRSASSLVAGTFHSGAVAPLLLDKPAERPMPLTGPAALFAICAVTCHSRTASAAVLLPASSAAI